MGKKRSGNGNGPGQDKYKKKITSKPATVSSSGINPPIPEFLWEAYPDDQELLTAVQPMTLIAIPFNGGESIEWLYDWMQVREYQDLSLIVPTTTAKQNPPFNGQFGDSYQNPNLNDPNDEPRHKDLLDRFFVAIQEKRRNINTHTNVKAAAWFAEMLEGVQEGDYITNPIILEIYEFGGGTPWRQLTVEDITNERQRRDDEETEVARREKFDQDVAFVNNEYLDTAAASYDRATYSQALSDAKVWWDQQTDP